MTLIKLMKMMKWINNYNIIMKIKGTGGQIFMNNKPILTRSWSDEEIVAFFEPVQVK